MSDSLIKALEKAGTRKGGKKRKTTKKRRSSRRRRAKKPTVKIRFRTKTVVKRVYVRKAASAPRRRKASKKRRATKKRKSGKVSKAEFLRRMALGRARAKRARKH